MEETSSVPCIIFSTDKTVFRKNGNKKYEELNQLVVTYKAEKNDKALLGIINLTKNLINKVLKDYNISMFPPDVQEEISANCFTLVLLKTIDSYDISKGAFSTHFTWRLRSYVAGKKRDNTKRAHMHRTISLVEDPVHSSDDSMESQIHLSDGQKRFFSKNKRTLIDFFEGRASCI